MSSKLDINGELNIEKDQQRNKGFQAHQLPTLGVHQLKVLRSQSFPEYGFQAPQPPTLGVHQLKLLRSQSPPGLGDLGGRGFRGHIEI